MLNSLVFDEARYQRLLEGAATLVCDGEQPDAEEVRSLISCIDNTTLNGNDTEASVSAFVRRTMELQQGAVPPVAAICVYPYFVPLVKQLLGTGPIAVAAVAGGFPAGQLPLPLKVAEVKAVVEMGADEVDYVINRGAYLTGGQQALYDEVAAARQAAGQAHLKVILETGELPSPALVYNAAVAALAAGADFVKTSTGKIAVGATPEAACAMLMAVSDVRQFSQKNVGFKVAGGVRTVQQALMYYRFSKNLLNIKGLDSHNFRIGSSSLANQLLALLTN